MSVRSKMTLVQRQLNQLDAIEFTLAQLTLEMSAM
jgi:hypothetical protein